MKVRFANSYDMTAIWVNIRIGHAHAKYAVHADYAHMRDYTEADENLIHIKKYLPKIAFFGPKMGQPGSVFNSEYPEYH